MQKEAKNQKSEENQKCMQKKAIALQKSSSYWTIKKREKKDNPILKLSLKVRLLT